MKASVAIITVFVLFINLSFYKIRAVDDSIKKDFATIRNQCKESSGVSEESLEKVQNGIPVNDDPLLKDMAVCILKAYSVIDNNGKLDKAELKGLLTVVVGEEKAKKAVEKCAKEKGTLQDTASETLFCLKKEKVLPEDN